MALAGGDGGILQTLSAMRRDARTFAASPAYRLLADSLAGHGSRTAQWVNLRMFLRTNTGFTPDPSWLELVRTAYEQLRALRNGPALGDCDDIATLAAALVVAVGGRARFVVLGFGPPGPAADYTHVYAEMETAPGVWRDFDLTRQAASPAATRRMEVLV